MGQLFDLGCPRAGDPGQHPDHRDEFETPTSCDLVESYRSMTSGLSRAKFAQQERGLGSVGGLSEHG
jgi:hypothetical protein